MKNILIIALLLFQGSVFGQIYFNDNINKIYKYDRSSCTVDSGFEAAVEDTLTDLAIRQDGQLYGVTSNGKLYQINPEAGTVLLIHSFLNLQTFKALYFAADGKIYTAGSEGFLYTYEVGTKKEAFLGDVGNDIEDLLSYNEELYASINSKKLLHVNLENPALSNIVMDLTSMETITGLCSTENPDDPCDLQTMLGITSEGLIYQINTEAGNSTEICDLKTKVYGATAMQDLFKFIRLEILNISTKPTQCKTNTGEIDLTTQGGIGQVLYSINDAAFQEDSIFSGLQSGGYTLKIKDENNCIVSSSDVQIIETESPVIDDIEQTIPPCEEGKGSIYIKAHGITNLQYSISGETYQDSENFEIKSGQYEVWVQDSNGCKTKTSINMSPEKDFAIRSIDLTPSTCNEENGEIIIELNGEFNDLEYFIDSEINPSSQFSNVPAGSHVIHIGYGNECQIDTIVSLSSNRCPVFIPNAISPDADGINDEFRIYTNDSNEVLVRSYSIFDRWGSKIYTAENFSIHQDENWWDGRINATNITQGLYVYIIELVHQDGETEIFKGQLNIL
ncbi:MAG: gliding motility-associated C-terminal domain-containing protein [Saprospiraceae bacterium]|nr:gliding motility-associated C-terminal domain-containing protein [Saprospiraceae bacterium]